jgi:hypothetical protein
LFFELVSGWLLFGVVGPRGRNHRAGAIRENGVGVEDTTTMQPSQRIERSPLEWMARADDGYVLRVFTVVVVGSVSSGRSTPFRTTS